MFICTYNNGSFRPAHGFGETVQVAFDNCYEKADEVVTPSECEFFEVSEPLKVELSIVTEN